MNKLKTISAVGLFGYLAKHMNDDNKVVAVSSEAMDDLEISSATFYRARIQLLQLDYVRSISDNYYMVNPAIQYNGKKSNKQVITFTYNRIPQGVRKYKKQQ